ncbi:MAG TPA: universal stress protein [Marmoricola sp.]|nr:universal stress protein [Marmoricola sp.]
MASGTVSNGLSSGADSNVSQRIEIPGREAEGHHSVRLVVGFDRQPVSLQALDVAADLATRLRAELHVVHAVDLADYPIDPDSADWDEQAEAVLAEEHEKVREVLNRKPVPWAYHAAHGDPVDLLTAVADERDALMIVVGTRGHSRTAAIARLLDRSVTRALTGRGQHRPVLIVPLPEATH